MLVMRCTKLSFFELSQGHKTVSASNYILILILNSYSESLRYNCTQFSIYICRKCMRRIHKTSTISLLLYIYIIYISFILLSFRPFIFKRHIKVKLFYKYLSIISISLNQGKLFHFSDIHLLHQYFKYKHVNVSNSMQK